MLTDASLGSVLTIPGISPVSYQWRGNDWNKGSGFLEHLFKICIFLQTQQNIVRVPLSPQTLTKHYPSGSSYKRPQNAAEVHRV